MSIRRRINRWRIKRRIRIAKRMLRVIDQKMAEMGAPAWKRQQIRRDIITSDKAWIDFADLIGGGARS